MSQTRSLLAAPEAWAAPDSPFLPFGDGADALALYADALMAWNKRLNLTGARSTADLLANLIQDSFFLARFLDDLCACRGWSDPAVSDLGAGAGLPGIPLRIFWRIGQYTMVESRQKRALFLENMNARLRLSRTAVFCGLAETYFASQPSAQVILSRAFMPWQKLLPFCAPGLDPAGLIVIMANEAPTGSRLCAADGQVWQLVAKMACQLPAKTHYLWAIGRPAIDHA